jgi:hypothetical protein
MQDVMAELVEHIGAGAASVDGKYTLLKVTMDGHERIPARQKAGVQRRHSSRSAPEKLTRFVSLVLET